MQTTGRVAGKVALVTGGADDIGFAIATLLAKEGAQVVIADISDEKGNQSATTLGGTYIHLDVSKEDAWKEAMAMIQTKFGHLNILVNNAGILATKGPQDPENMSAEDWKLVHTINLDSVFFGCKHTIPLMKDKGGSIVNMSSRSGIVGVPFASAYASTKAAVRNHSKSVALYCSAKGYPIRCNSVHPASIMTAMWKKMLGEGEDFTKNLAKFSADIPMKRFGTPEEVAQAVLFLASDESSYTTGGEITVDGGILAGTATSPDTQK